MWIFCFAKEQENGMIYPQAPNITVNKNDGILGKLVVLPIENLKIIRNAEVVDFEP